MNPFRHFHKVSELSVEREALAEALRSIEPLIAARMPDKWRKYVAVNGTPGSLRLTVHGQRDEVSVLLDAEGEAEIDCAIPHRALRKSTEAFSGAEVSLQFAEERLQLSSGTRVLKLDSEGTEIFPLPLELGAPTTSFEVPGTELAEALELTLKCASEDPLRPALNTIALDMRGGIPTLVATDSYRLATIELDGRGNNLESPQLLNLELAKATAKDIKRNKPQTVRIEVKESGTIITYNNIYWGSQQIEESFPNWRKSLQAIEGHKVSFKRREISQALKAIEAVAKGREPVRLELDKKSSIRYKAHGIGELLEYLPGSKWEGPFLEIGFGSDFLADMLKVIEGNPIEGLLKGPDDPGLFSSPGRQFLLMPNRVNDIQVPDDEDLEKL